MIANGSKPQKLKSGARPTRDKFKDWGWLETHKDRLIQKFGSLTPQFPPTLGRTLPTLIPNQEINDPAFNPPVLAEPFGCTNETQSAIKRFESNGMFRPDTLEAVTHANAKGGFGVTDALDACLPPTMFNPNRLGWFNNHFNIRPQQGLDYFGAAQLAIMDGLPESRAISVGSPWYSEFEQTGPSGILPTPASLSTVGVPWHNWMVFDWKTIGGTDYLIGLSWQGEGFGDKGFHYVSRPLFNSMMDLYGATMRIPTSVFEDSPKTIDISTMEWLKSFMRFILNLGGYGY